VAAGVDVKRIGMWLAVAVLVCASGVVSNAREYRTVEVELLRVTIDTDWVPRATPGYWPIRFDITNLGDARVIELVGQGPRVFRAVPRTPTSGVIPGGQGSTTVTQTLRLRRGDRVRFTMAVPIFGDSETYRFELREGNRTLERFNYYGLQSRTQAADASVLFVADSSSSFGSLVPKLTRNIGSRSGVSGGVMLRGRSGTVTMSPGFAPTMGGRMPPIDYALEPGRLPVNWTGYTSVRAVAIGKTEWDQLEDSQKNALLMWVACGGDLILLDAQVADLLPTIPTTAAGRPERTVGRHFFGRVHALTSATLETAGMADMLMGLDDSRSAAWSLPANGASDWGSIETRGFRLRIPGIDGIPARVYLSILVLFSVLIGPVSFWFLWRRGQRVLLVLTAPIISIVFIILLAGYAGRGRGLRRVWQRSNVHRAR
jgi:hypothetical protein